MIAEQLELKKILHFSSQLSMLFNSRIKDDNMDQIKELDEALHRFGKMFYDVINTHYAFYVTKDIDFSLQVLYKLSHFKLRKEDSTLFKEIIIKHIPHLLSYSPK